VKTRLQSYSPSSPSIGAQHAYVNRGAMDALITIYKTQGIHGLFRGMDAAMIRTGIGSAVQLSSYDACKRLIAQTRWFQNDQSRGASLHFSASLLTGLIVCIVMNPPDVISTRMV